MTGFDAAQYLGVFLEEAEEQLQLLNEGLLLLEKNCGDEATINRIFRAIHTLKGSSASMGFDTMATLAHEIENVLDQVRRNELQVTQTTIDLLLSCLDSLQVLKETAATGQEATLDVKTLTAGLRQLQAHAGRERVFQAEELPAAPGSQWQLSEVELKVVRAAAAKGYQVYHVTVQLAADCLMKAVRAYLVFNRLQELGEIIKTEPPAAEIEEEKFDRRLEMVVVTTEQETRVIKAIQTITEIEHVKVQPLQIGANDTSGEDESSQPVTQDGNSGNSGRAKVAQTVRVDVQRLENLMNLVGELVIDRTRLTQVNELIKTKLDVVNELDDLTEIIAHLGRITGELQDEIMKARMLPIDQVFNRFPRMVRDLSRKADKEVQLLITGQETELDRTVIEEIGDPLIHLIRNAIDHGLEPPADRRQAGKPLAGQLHLSAEHRENQIIINIADDGRGMDPDKIRQKAVEKGLVAREAADRLTNRDCLNLIFVPGFSTAQTVSDVSGRGVGMDIVRHHLEKIGGLIEIDTRLGQGTRFTIKLPLTLAISRSLLVREQQQIYAFPLVNVVEILNTKSEDRRLVHGQEVVMSRGSVLPLVSLEQALGGARHDLPEHFPVVVVGIAERRVGFVVGQLLGEQEIVIKSFGSYLGRVPGFAGATILGDGQVALILDIHRLLARVGGD